MEHLRLGDNVTVVGRRAPCIGHISFVHCDVSDPLELQRVIREEVRGPVDMWINNAASSDQSVPFAQQSVESVNKMVMTNVVAPMVVLKTLGDLEHDSVSIFNMSGAGSDGRATSLFCVYGATKAGITQFTKSMSVGAGEGRRSVVHLVSPGLMSTDLLLTNLDPSVKAALDMFTSDPQVVAKHIVPMMRRAHYNGKPSHIIFQTPLKIVGKIIMKLLRII